MKKILIALTAVLFCVLLASCTKESVRYSMGFESVSVSEKDQEKIEEECPVVENAFISSIQTNLGVTVSNTLFYYNGGDAKIKEACEIAAASLSSKSFVCKFKYVVTREDIAIYTWAN